MKINRCEPNLLGHKRLGHIVLANAVAASVILRDDFVLRRRPLAPIQCPGAPPDLEIANVPARPFLVYLSAHCGVVLAKGDWRKRRDFRFLFDGGVVESVSVSRFALQIEECDLYTFCFQARRNWKSNDVDQESQRHNQRQRPVASYS
jgi:hypothetical protein